MLVDIPSLMEVLRDSDEIQLLRIQRHRSRMKMKTAKEKKHEKQLKVFSSPRIWFNGIVSAAYRHRMS